MLAVVPLLLLSPASKEESGELLDPEAREWFSRLTGEDGAVFFAGERLYVCTARGGSGKTCTGMTTTLGRCLRRGMTDLAKSKSTFLKSRRVWTESHGTKQTTTRSRKGMARAQHASAVYKPREYIKVHSFFMRSLITTTGSIKR